MKSIEVLLLSRNDVVELGLAPSKVVSVVEDALREHAVIVTLSRWAPLLMAAPEETLICALRITPKIRVSAPHSIGLVITTLTS